MLINRIILCLFLIFGSGATGCAYQTPVSDALVLAPFHLEALVNRHVSLLFNKIPEGDLPMSTGEWMVAKPNELGSVMIVMYHRVTEEETIYDRSFDNFRGDLERLYSEGYRPVSMSSYIHGEIDLPAGLSPVILTFDDGHISNFKYEEDETTISGDSVVGIMLDFQRSHPDFTPKGIFYLTGPTPFGQKSTVEKKLKTLVELGFEVGNHTTSHKKLSGLNAQSISAEIGSMNHILENWSDHTVTHLSIPYGMRPKDTQALRALYESQSIDYEYHMESVVNVGWKPAPSPFSANFDPLSLNRVTSESGDFGLHYWLDYYQKHPDKRYVSDGDSTFISIHEQNLSELSQNQLHGDTLRTYFWEE